MKTPVSDHLFGPNLGEKIKTSKAIQKSGPELKHMPKTSYSTSKTTRACRGQGGTLNKPQGTTLNKRQGTTINKQNSTNNKNSGNNS